MRLCQDVRYKGPVPAVLKHLKEGVLVVDVDDFLNVRFLFPPDLCVLTSL